MIKGITLSIFALLLASCSQVKGVSYNDAKQLLETHSATLNKVAKQSCDLIALSKKFSLEYEKDDYASSQNRFSWQRMMHEIGNRYPKDRLHAYRLKKESKNIQSQFKKLAIEFEKTAFSRFIAHKYYDAESCEVSITLADYTVNAGGELYSLVLNPYKKPKYQKSIHHELHRDLSKKVHFVQPLFDNWYYRYSYSP